MGPLNTLKPNRESSPFFDSGKFHTHHMRASKKQRDSDSRESLFQTWMGSESELTNRDPQLLKRLKVYTQLEAP